MNGNITTIIERIDECNPTKVVFSNPRDKSVQYKKIVVILKELSRKTVYQVERYTEKQVFHENIEVNKLKELIKNTIELTYKQVNVFSDTGEIEVKFNKTMTPHMVVRKYEQKKMLPVTKGNNRRKNYILEEGMDIPVFRELGIFTSENKVVASKYDKFKQINRFTELIDDAIKDYGKDEINIIDFGCGKSYLTFVLYYYLTEIKSMKANIIGLDLKADVIMKCNALSDKYGYSGLRFEIGNIDGYKAPFEVDMVVTLHACDTATDFALYNAISWGSKIIMSVPCCQHEVNTQIKSDRFSAITKYGIIKERTSALITDAIRGCMLEYSGYKTDLVEFIDAEHSPKNIMIRAKKSNVSVTKREKSLAEAKRICDEFALSQTLMSLLASR